MEKIKDSVIVMIVIVGGIIFVFQLLRGLLVLPVALYQLIKLLLPLVVFIFITYLISLVFKKK